MKFQVDLQKKLKVGSKVHVFELNGDVITRDAHIVAMFPKSICVRCVINPEIAFNLYFSRFGRQ